MGPEFGVTVADDLSVAQAKPPASGTALRSKSAMRPTESVTLPPSQARQMLLKPTNSVIDKKVNDFDDLSVEDEQSVDQRKKDGAPTFNYNALNDIDFKTKNNGDLLDLNF